MRKLLWIVVLAGCVAAEDRDLIRVSAAAGRGDLREWETLSEVQRKAAMEGQVRDMEALDLSINGHALPAGSE